MEVAPPGGALAEDKEQAVEEEDRALAEAAALARLENACVPVVEKKCRMNLEHFVLR